MQRRDGAFSCPLVRNKIYQQMKMHLLFGLDVDLGVTAALVSLGGNNLVVVRAQVHA